MGNVWVIRHGKTDGNAQQIHQGWLPYDLNEEGSRQARAARDWFGQQNIAMVACSPLLRTRTTAKEIFGRVDLLLPEWAEICCPLIEGMTYAEAHERYPHLVGANGWPVLDGPRVELFESPRDFLARTSRALGVALGLAADLDGDLCVVAHGAHIAALSHLLGSPLGDTPGNLSSVRVSLGVDGGPRLVGVGGLSVWNTYVARSSSESLGVET